MPRLLLLIYCALATLGLLAALARAIYIDAGTLLLPLCFGVGYFGRATWIEVRRLRAERPLRPAQGQHVRARPDIT